MSKNRGWIFVLNNYTEEEWLGIKDWPGSEEEITYLVCGKEVGPKCGTPHLQGYVRWKNARCFNSMKKLLPKAHWAPAKASDYDNLVYCSKDGDFFDYGQKPKQGKRTDLISIRDRILEGERVDDIIMEKPHLGHQYGRTMDRMEDITMRKKFRNVMTEGLWIWGDTGVGKSQMAFKEYTPETHYVWPNDGKWWDGYRQQDTVVLNDFRGEIPYNMLLQLVDWCPMWVPRRSREPMPFISKRVIITSSLPPERIYHHRMEEDCISQLLRRFRVLELKNGPIFEKLAQKCSEGNTKTSELLDDDFETDSDYETVSNASLGDPFGIQIPR